MTRPQKSHAAQNARALRRRMDGDGDLKMLGEGPGLAARFAPYSGKGKRSGGKAPPMLNQVDLVVTGHEGAPEDDFRKFIFRKSQARISNVSHLRTEGSRLIFSVSESNKGRVLTLNGVKFAGDTITIVPNTPYTTTTPEQAAKTLDLKATFEAFLASRYHPETKFLNLSALSQEAGLREKGLFTTMEKSSKMFLAMMTIAEKHLGDVHSVDLSNNGLVELRGISILSQSYPSLKNLSLENNKLDAVEKLDVWFSRSKFPALVELVLRGNPFVGKMSGEEYQKSILKRFPSLILLDGITIQTDDIGPNQPSMFESEELQTQVMAFLGAHDHRITKLNTTPDQISRIFKLLPKTIHDLSNPHLFSIQAWTINEGVHVTISGEFTDPEYNIKRSFDRSLLLVGPTPQCTALGVAAAIRNDLLTVRSYSGNLYLEYIQKLKSQTKLNDLWAKLCLEQSQWQFHVAVENFNRERPNIPVDAFTD
ncbi:mRNA export factor mex67 [Neolecta irregularis DAH-3]|uniref:mRNA export factor mex67 n=1 Tax=Neolecta irregularis (strain DAH-3) TaxID=1198029 RepID=A0A1U7LL36_NEOID|nr:mRNA export factor mex67 [Neolecta irregularis DAH-3]|eukprot:OLL23376.1 mRNA export factor mex67 [Neolecta irregularis DAH-3]